MKPKAILRRTVDLLMSFGLLFLMGYQFWGDAAHEWAGAGMFLLVAAHHALNAGWYKNLFHGRYSAARIGLLSVDLLTFLAMAGLMASGILLSSHVFACLHLRGGMSFARLLHMAASHWGFVLMALHLGLHWGAVLADLNKALGLERPSRGRTVLCSVLGAGVAVYGLIAFVRRGFPTYMLVRAQFVSLDFSEPVPLFYLDYLAMLGAFIFLACSLPRLPGMLRQVFHRS